MATKKATRGVTGTVINFTFAHGESVDIDYAGLTPEIQTQLGLHGLSQKIGDSYAGTKTSEEAYRFAAGVAERLANGDFKAIRESSGAARITQLVEALAAVTGRSVEEAQARLDGMSDEEKKDLRSHPAVKAAVADIKAKNEMAKAERLRAEAEGSCLEL